MENIVLNKYVIKELFTTVEATKENGPLSTLLSLKGYANYELINNENNELLYKVSVDKLIKNQVPTDVLVILRDGGWELSDDESYIFYKLG